MRLVATVAACLVMAAASQARAGDGPEAWRTYQVWLWTFGETRVDASFLAGLRALGITGINREGRAPAAPVRAAGLTFYVGHAAGKGILQLRRPTFQRCWDGYWRERTVEHLQRPRCPRDPAVLAELGKRLLRTIDAQAPHGPLAYSLADEISLTRRITPLDFCYCARCLAAFRAWLRDRYGSLERLNDTWRTHFATWEEVHPYTADEIKRRERRMPRRRWVLAPWSDHREFMDAAWAATLDALRRVARRHGVRVPVGFLGGQAPAPYGGYDWGRLVHAVDWLEVYDEGGAMEVVRGLNDRVIRVRTYFTAGRGEGLNRYRLWEYFAHGERGAILWSSREIFDAAGEPTAYARGLAPALARLTGPAAARIMPLPVADDGVALYYSQAGIRFTWMMDSARDGRTWMKRFGSYERDHSTAYRRRMSWHRVLEDVGVQYRYVDSRAVAKGESLDGVRVLILPDVRWLSRPEREALRKFLDGGGTLLVDRPPYGAHALLMDERVVILESDLLPYAERAGHHAADRKVLAEVGARLAAAGVEPPCRATNERGERGGIEVLRRPASSGTYYFVRWNLPAAAEKTLTAAAWGRRRTIRVTFPAPVKAREVFGAGRWAGRTLERDVAVDRPWVFFVEKP